MRIFLLLILLFNLTVISAHDKETSVVDDPIVDFSMSNFTLTADDETHFQYSFNLTNGGTSEIQGYNMVLTFSADNVLDANDIFSVFIPLADDVSQWIGPNQTLVKNGHYNATSPSGYLPVGTWYIFAEINYDQIVPETNYLNNSTLSVNTLVVSAYTIPFATPPQISAITDNSFEINSFFQQDMTRIYYRVQANGNPVPSPGMMLASDGMFPWENNVHISGLGPAFDYDVYFMGEFYDGKATLIHKVDVKTLGTATPTVRISTPSLLLESTGKNKESNFAEYSIAAFHLTSNVTVTAPGNFRVSKDNITYSNQVTYLAASFAQGISQVIYVKFSPDGVAGIKSGNIVNASTGAASINLSVSISVFDPTSDNFNGLTSLSETGWTSYSVTGYHTWSLIDLDVSSPHQRESGDDKAIQIDGSVNGFTANEDWLISPEIDLSGYLYDPTLRFKSYSSGDGASLKLKYSATYTGAGDPRTAVWFDADAEFPLPNSNEWTKTSSVLFNKESKIYFAFVYTSTITAGSRWTIDDWRITDNLLLIPSNTLSYQDVEVGTASASQSLPVRIAGYGDVMVSVSEGFQISLNNSTFSSSVVIAEAEAEAGKSIYARFTPFTQVQGHQGTLTFTANDLSVSSNSLVGSSLLATATSRPIEYTSFIYPNPTEGVIRVDLSALYNQSADMPVSVANSMGAAVAGFNSSVTSLEANLSDVVSNLKPGLYYITIQGDDTIYRSKLVKQ